MFLVLSVLAAGDAFSVALCYFYLCFTKNSHTFLSHEPSSSFPHLFPLSCGVDVYLISLIIGFWLWFYDRMPFLTSTTVVSVG